MAIHPPISIPPAFQSVGDVVTGLKGLQRLFVDRKDRRGIFATAYVETTNVFCNWIDENRFLNNQLVTRYIVAFANAYREALANYEEGDFARVPAAWRSSFDTSVAGKGSMIQDLLLAINAHINHDLPFAVLKGGLDVRCNRCITDHLRMNDALKSATPRVRRAIVDNYQPRLQIVNWLYGHAFDSAVANCFERSRSNSWTLAKALYLADGPAARSHIGNVIHDRAGAAAQGILTNRYSLGKCLTILSAA